MAKGALEKIIGEQKKYTVVGYQIGMKGDKVGDTIVFTMTADGLHEAYTKAKETVKSILEGPFSITLEEMNHVEFDSRRDQED